MFPVELRIKKGDGHRKDQDGGGNIFYGGGEGHHQKRAHQKAQQCRKALHAGTGGGHKAQAKGSVCAENLTA